ncbi:hypothetical protein [Tissierella praeacuta]
MAKLKSTKKYYFSVEGETESGILSGYKVKSMILQKPLLNVS